MRAVEPLWTIEDVSEYLKIPVDTIYAWRSRKKGPPATPIGRHLRYRREDVEAWFEGLREKSA